MGILDQLKKYQSPQVDNQTKDAGPVMKQLFYPSEAKKLFFLLRDADEQMIKTRVLNISMTSVAIDMHGYQIDTLQIDALVSGFLVDKIEGQQSLNKIPCQLLVKRIQKINQFSCIVGYDFTEVDLFKVSGLLKRLEAGHHVET